ncbi:MAG: NADPH-dependent FMN reductase [Chitinophagaceae bacterium]
MNVEIISGSPRKDSVSYRVALFLQKHLATRAHYHTGVLDVREWNLPLLQEVFSSVENTPEPYKPLSKRIFEADAFILVTPEYNGSYTPALKNLLDHYPKQARKAFGIVTASPGMMGGMRATQQMQLLVNAFFGIASPHMLIVPGVDKKFDPDGNLIDENFRKNIDQFTNEFCWLAERLKSN